jgi:hypothetical protein
MNTMTNAMTWDAIAANEGNTISEISLTEIDDVSGGRRFRESIRTAAAVIVASCVVAQTGRAMGWW